jgi:molybdate transport system substrate-binding protein
MSFMKTLLLLVAIFSAMLTDRTMADTVHVAVASNFTEAARELAHTFRKNTGHEAILSFGSSGQLYTQIRESAPFEVFLSADEERPKKLVEEGLAVSNEEFTYAIGKLVLWSKKSGFVKSEETLKKGDFSKIVIANPAAAPYGVAAIEAMKTLNVHGALQPKIVQGNSIAQTFQFINTDNAELGFIALSQIPNQKEGSWWIVPETLYKPIYQDAVLLKTGEKSDAAKAFMKFLKGSVAQSIIQKSGYATHMIPSGHK